MLKIVQSRLFGWKTLKFSILLDFCSRYYLKVSHIAGFFNVLGERNLTTFIFQRLSTLAKWNVERSDKWCVRMRLIVIKWYLKVELDCSYTPICMIMCQQQKACLFGWHSDWEFQLLGSAKTQDTSQVKYKCKMVVTYRDDCDKVTKVETFHNAIIQFTT